MTPNKRIFLNVVATYGRSLYALVIGLVCGRWTLMALGKSDYGLLGVVGGLTFFISYFNAIIASSYGRFFALSVGEERANPGSGLENSRMWFTTAMVVQMIVPTFLMILGYPIGEWAIKDFLTIPPDRIHACLLVWRCVCASCYLGMVSIPLNAMYVAHQYIAELTIYSFVTTTLNALFLFYMVGHPGEWLVRLAIWQCILNILPNTIIAVRAFYIFKECRIVRRHINCWKNLKRISAYAFWNAWGTLGAVLRGQGVAVLVNKYFGPVVNAGVAIGTNVSSQCNSLAASMQAAFSPAVYNAWGEGNFELARRLAYRMCKFGTLFILMFALPLALEVDEVLLLWLKDPPQWAAEICLFVLVMTAMDKLATGHMICVNAKGKVAAYQTFLGSALVMTLPLAWGLIVSGLGVYSIGIAMVATMFVCVVGRVAFAQKIVGMSVRYWACRILAPISLLVMLSCFVGILPKMFFNPSFMRVCITTLSIELLFIPFAWLFVLDKEENEFIRGRIMLYISRLKGRK